MVGGDVTDAEVRSRSPWTVRLRKSKRWQVSFVIQKPDAVGSTRAAS